MRVIEPGHHYQLRMFDGSYMSGDEDERLRFMKREGAGYPGNVGHHPGTNIQEVLRALIDRVKYLEAQIPNHHNEIVINLLRGALRHLEIRAADRHHRDFVGELEEIEKLPTCNECGHIGCQGHCGHRRVA